MRGTLNQLGPSLTENSRKGYSLYRAFINDLRRKKRHPDFRGPTLRSLSLKGYFEMGLGHNSAELSNQPQTHSEKFLAAVVVRPLSSPYWGRNFQMLSNPLIYPWMINRPCGVSRQLSCKRR